MITSLMCTHFMLCTDQACCSKAHCSCAAVEELGDIFVCFLTLWCEIRNNTY